jgi:hypothetical protein
VQAPLVDIKIKADDVVAMEILRGNVRRLSTGQAVLNRRPDPNTTDVQPPLIVNPGSHVRLDYDNSEDPEDRKSVVIERIHYMPDEERLRYK